MQWLVLGFCGAWWESFAWRTWDWVAFAAEFFSGNIVFFTTGAVFLAALFVTFKRYTTIVYVLSLFLFLVGLYKFQKNLDLLFFNTINSTLAIFFAYCLNLIFFHHKLSDFLNSKIIDQKNHEITKTPIRFSCFPKLDHFYSFLKDTHNKYYSYILPKHRIVFILFFRIKTISQFC